MSAYNGWANRATWAAHLNLSNEKSVYDAAREWLKRGGDLREFMERVLNSRPEMAEEIGPLSLVNWGEVAQALVRP